jgi:hypothetical protein
MDRALLCPDVTTVSAYLRHDERAVAPIRARIRLCETALGEHAVLRHRIDATSGLPLCRACRMTQKTVDHVFLECGEFAEARREAIRCLDSLCGDLRRRDLLLDRRAIAGIPPADLADDAAALFLRATGGLLLAVYASPWFGHLRLVDGGGGAESAVR